MPIETKTLDELEAIGRGAIRALIPDADVSPGSDYDTTVRMAAALAMGQQANAEYVARQIFPESADEENLLLHAKARGTFRQPAAKSVGVVAIVAVATGVAIPPGQVFTHGDGTRFVSTLGGLTDTPSFTGKTVAPDSTPFRLVVHPSTTGMFEGQILTVNGEPRAIRDVLTAVSCVDLYEPLPVTPASGTAITATIGCVVDIEAEAIGIAGNKPIGDLLTMVAPPTDVGPTAHIAELGGGGDVEVREALRARVMDIDAVPPACGNASHIRELARTVAGTRVEDAVVFPGFRGLGTVDVFPIGVPGARLLPSTSLTRIRQAIEAVVPESLDVSVQALAPGVFTNVDVTVTTERGYERDFSVGPFAIDTGSTTRRIRITTAPTGIEIGDRIQVQQEVGGRWRVLHVGVTGLSSAAPHFIDVDADLPLVPLVTDPNVISGGTLVEPIRAAILALFDGLGPSARSGASWAYERWPLPTEKWTDTLTMAAIIEALMGVPGVANVTLAEPAADITPSAQQLAQLAQLTIRFVEVA
jgi:uncharacterized phage protein gp47/JayE